MKQRANVNWARVSMSLLAAAVALTIPAGGVAGRGDSSVPDQRFRPPPRPVGLLANLDGRLHAIVKARRAAGQEGALSAAREERVASAGGRLLAVAVVRSGRIAEAKAAVEAAGGAVTGRSANLLEVAVPS